MYRTLFDLAGLAIFGWLPLILFPGWRVSRWLGQSLVFPVYLSLLYLIGIVPIVIEAGPRIMADFGNLSGVLSLMAREEVVLIVWIHILAFDHLVGLLVYRHNMQHRTVPLPVQSVILFLCLMFGPVGFLIYGACYLVRRRPPTPSTEEPAHTSPAPPSPPSPTVVLHALRREALLAGLGLTGILLGLVCLAAIPFLGVEVPPEGNLRDTASFNLGVGIFTLTLAFILPLAPFSERGARLWRITMSAIVIYFYAIETIQAFRGLDPRFTRHGGIVDQVSGAFFGITAIGMVLTTLVLAVAFFRRGHRDLLTVSVRYGFAAIVIAFGIGLWMSAIRGRGVGEAGNLLVAHGFGFHGIQAVPIVALLLHWSRTRNASQILHVAGAGWLLATATLLVQAMLGEPAFAPTYVTGIAALALAAWGAALLTAALAWLRERLPATSGSLAETSDQRDAST
ncbi:MAG TPA: ABA4-like family protein [Thermoanaerobaculia bacterium]